MLKKFTKFVLYNKINKYYPTTAVKLHTSIKQMQKEGELSSVDKKHENTINDILNKYTSEDAEKILNIVNSYSLMQLLSYDISKAKANKLLSWRERNGLLQNLSDIFTIEGFGLKVTDKFYQSLLQKPKTVGLSKATKARTAPFVTPALEAEQRNLIKSCVSVRIGVNSITWARLEMPSQNIEAPCELTHWEHHEISDKKLHLNDLIQRCLYVNHQIPMADCYVFENPQMAQASNNPGSVEQQNINIQKAQVIAVMGYALASRNSQLRGLAKFEDNKEAKYLPNVFYLRRFLTARLFNHLVGTERVSSEETVLYLMRTYYNVSQLNDDVMLSAKGQVELIENEDNPGEEINFSGCVQFPNELRQTFSKSNRYYREYLGQALLLNLAFVRLVLLQDAESIALVTRSNRKKYVLNNEV